MIRFFTSVGKSKFFLDKSIFKKRRYRSKSNCMLLMLTNNVGRFECKFGMVNNASSFILGKNLFFGRALILDEMLILIGEKHKLSRELLRLFESDVIKMLGKHIKKDIALVNEDDLYKLCHELSVNTEVTERQ